MAGMLAAEDSLASVTPDATLAALYKSARPPVELLPGLSLSAIVNSAWLPSDAKTMLSASWIPAPAEGDLDAPQAPPPPSFDPKAIEYKDMMKRVCKSMQLSRWNELKIKIKTLEVEMVTSKEEGLAAELEGAQAQLAEAEAQLAELKASFTDDPLSLVPWMQTLFDLVDAGLTTFEVGGPFFPHTGLKALFSSSNAISSYESAEKVLGIFKKRCDKERGLGKVQVMARIVPNIFEDEYSPSMIEPLIDSIRINVYGAEAPEPLDFVQVYWWDPKDQDALPTLKVLQKMAEDKVEVNEETGEVTVTEAKKIKGIGLVDFPARSIMAAIQAGVPVIAVQIPFGVANRSYAATLAVCRQYNIKVLARDGTMGGVISEKYIGRPCPETTKADTDLDDVAHSLDMINNYGGWDKVQQLLKVVKDIADKHRVKMQTVVLRWQIDNGTFPVVTMRWNRQSWRQFGYDFWGGPTPGLDWQLFQVESFLDASDMKALNALAS